MEEEDWKALEDAGWLVDWNREFVFRRGQYVKDEGGFPTFKWSKGKDWLGGKARNAWKKFDSVSEGIREFEELTGECADDEGCNCCGQPHNFSEF